MGDALTAVLLSKLLDRRGGGTSRRRASSRKKPSKRRKSKTGKRSRSSFYVSKKLSCPKGYKTKYKTSKMRKCTRKRGSGKGRTPFEKVWHKQNKHWSDSLQWEEALNPLAVNGMVGPSRYQWDPRFPEETNLASVGAAPSAYPPNSGKRVRADDEWMDDDEYVL